MINTDQKVLDAFETKYDNGEMYDYFSYWTADDPWFEDQADEFMPGWYIDHGFKFVTTLDEIKERIANGEQIDWRYHDTKTKEDTGHGLIEWTEEEDPDDDFDWYLDEIGGSYQKKIKDYEIRVDSSTCTTAMIFITISKGDKILVQDYDANHSRWSNIEGIFAECLNDAKSKGSLTEEQYEFLVRNI